MPKRPPLESADAAGTKKLKAFFSPLPVAVAGVSNSVLHVAVASNDVELVKLLLDQGDDPNATNENSDTPLHVCLRKGEEEMAECVRELVHHGADVSHYNNDDESPVDLALEHKWSRDFIELLVLKGHGMDFDRLDEERISKFHRSPVAQVVLEQTGGYLLFRKRSSLHTSRDDSLAILFLQMGASRRNLETCLWYELNRGEPGGPVLDTLMDSFAHLPSLSQLEENVPQELGEAIRMWSNIYNYSFFQQPFDAQIKLLGHSRRPYSLVMFGDFSSSQNPVGPDAEAYKKIIQEKKMNYIQRRGEVPTLLHLSRCTVRRTMKANVRGVISLPIPTRLKECILLGYQLETQPRE